MEVTGRYQGVILMNPKTSVEYGLKYKLQDCNYSEPPHYYYYHDENFEKKFIVRDFIAVYLGGRGLLVNCEIATCAECTVIFNHRS